MSMTKDSAASIELTHVLILGKPITIKEGVLE